MLDGPGGTVPPGPSSIENDAQGIEKLLLKTQVSEVNRIIQIIIIILIMFIPWLVEAGGSMPHSQGFFSNPYPQPN